MRSRIQCDGDKGGASYLIQDHPVSGLQSGQQRTVPPCKLAPLASLHWEVGPKQIRHVLQEEMNCLDHSLLASCLFASLWQRKSTRQQQTCCLMGVILHTWDVNKRRVLAVALPFAPIG